MTIEKFIKKNQTTIKKTIENYVDPATAEDIEQDVYIKLWKNSNYKKNMGFIKTVVINTCKDFFRSKNYKLSQLNNKEDDELLKVTDDKDSAEHNIDNKFRQKLIKKAIDKLPVKLKEVIILYDIEELQQDAIAKKLNCPIGTVKSRLFKARKLLCEELKTLLD